MNLSFFLSTLHYKTISLFFKKIILFLSHMEKDQMYVFRAVECSLVIKFFCCLVGWLGVSFFFFFWQGLGGMWHALWDLSSPPTIKPVPPKVEGQSLNHWTTREVPKLLFHIAPYFVSWVVHLL